ncbi:MAG: InlB B-repeat-containing protein [Defluviitaleaceae bacterium]|nr:InlB B-repeat-containing protein [Defluviitaleaceae bacterium]
MKNVKHKVPKVLCFVLVLLIALGGFGYLISTQAFFEQQSDDGIAVYEGFVDNELISLNRSMLLIPEPDYPSYFVGDSFDEFVFDNSNLEPIPEPRPYYIDDGRQYYDLIELPMDFVDWQDMLISEPGFEQDRDIQASSASSVYFHYSSSGHDSGSPPAGHFASANGVITLRDHNNMFRAWFRFAGWYNGGLAQPGHVFNFGPGSHGWFPWDARWVPGVTVDYRSVGHTSGTVPAPHSADANGRVTFAHHNLARTGYRFMGWRNGVTRQPGEFFDFGPTRQDHFTFYAVWERVQVTFQYRSTGHTSGTVPASHSVVAPMRIEVANPGNLARTGYFFNGWRRSDNLVLQPGNGFFFPAGTLQTWTFDAIWVRSPSPIINLNYEIYVSSNVPGAHARSLVGSVKPGFRNTFGINFVYSITRVTTRLDPRQTNIPCFSPHQSGRCDHRCGIASNGSDCRLHHHRSGDYMVRMRYPISGSRHVFRFVDYHICNFNGVNHSSNYVGLAFIGDLDMIVTTAARHPLVVTAHEISHNLGARCDRCTPLQLCVMSSWDTHNLWCDSCRGAIMAHRAWMMGMSSREVLASHNDPRYEIAICTPEASDPLVFLSLDEFIVNHNAIALDRGGSVADIINLAGLERLYLPSNLPLEYQLYRLMINENAVNLVYLHIDDMISEDTVMDALIQQRHFQFSFTRWDVDSPMEGILQQMGATEDDLINGRYLFVEPNMLIWASDREVIYMYTPLSLSNNIGMPVIIGNELSIYEASRNQIEFTKTSVINLHSGDVSYLY